MIDVGKSSTSFCLVATSEILRLLWSLIHPYSAFDRCVALKFDTFSITAAPIFAVFDAIDNHLHDSVERRQRTPPRRMLNLVRDSRFAELRLECTDYNTLST